MTEVDKNLKLSEDLTFFCQQQFCAECILHNPNSLCKLMDVLRILESKGVI